MWANKELSGYLESDSLPDYRISNRVNFEYSGLNGGFKIKNCPLPVEYFPEEIAKEISRKKSMMELEA